jgi:hypothetical protein
MGLDRRGVVVQPQHGHNLQGDDVHV